MKRKTFIKQLMALGFSRDAANKACRHARWLAQRINETLQGCGFSASWEETLAYVVRTIETGKMPCTKADIKNVYGQDGSVEGQKEQENAARANGGGDTMDAVKYLREITRMCTEYATCEGCPIGHGACRTMEVQEPEKIVAIVAEWAKGHPVETRQSRISKEFPNVIRTKYGTIMPAVCRDRHEVRESRMRRMQGEILE